jgi:acetyltransferase-like isoleucine patch superfamily enzyme
MKSDFLKNHQLKKIGFKTVGQNCKISKYTRTYNATINIGNNSRIDDDVILKGKVSIGSNVHLARGCTLSGGNKGICIGDFSTFSNFVQIFSSSDDYQANAIPSGTISKNLSKDYCALYESRIIIGEGCLFGSMCTILPGANVGDFSSFAAYSVIFKKIDGGIFYSKEKRVTRDQEMIKKKLAFLKNKIK